MEAGCSSLDEYVQCLISGSMTYTTGNTETRPMAPDGPVAVIGDALGVDLCQPSGSWCFLSAPSLFFQLFVFLRFEL